MAFSYHRAVAPMLWVMFGLSTIELAVIHLLLSFWSPRAALLVSVATAMGLIWLAYAIRLCRHRPVLLDHERVLMRVGGFRTIGVPLASIARIDGAIDRNGLRRRATVNLALIAHPNIVLRLEPTVVRRGRSIDTVAHRLDDPAAFVRALEAVGVGR